MRKNLSKARKAIVCFYVVVKQTLWNQNVMGMKQSAEVGLAGLTLREAARGALTCPEFQGMPDPLDPYGPVVKEEDVSTPY